MTGARASVAFAALVLAVLVPASVSAQSVRYRRPFFGSRSVSAYFDHSGGGGCTDWACGGVCYDGHSGTDYPMPVGTEVVAAASGRVITAFNGCADYGYFGNTCGGRCGNHVIIEHDDGSRSTYCHMRNGSHRVSVGDHVSCGQVIGSSASSGSSTGPHLHFGHRTAGSSSSDPYAGGCSRATSLWVDQGGYRGMPAESCADVCSPTGEVCNGRDDDCDGRTDEDLRRTCGTDVGECVMGTQGCFGGGWGACDGEVPPRPEECDGRDQDCDGATDEALSRVCGTDVGECVTGIETCSGARWGTCEGAVFPVDERCDRLDNDCDGTGDDEQICEREEVAWGASFTSEPDSDASGDGRADACAVMDDGISCVLGADRGFVRTLGGGELELASLFDAAAVTTGDLDGDGRAEVCGRQADRFVCFRSSGLSFDAVLPGPVMERGARFTLADVSGDGRLDACVRDAAGLACHTGDGEGFGERVVLPALSDDAGFGDVTHYGSLRFGDLDGDGRTDVCVRGAGGLSCWRSLGTHWGERIAGPEWSDAAGYGAIEHWSTLRLGDVNGDGRADACIAAFGELRCALFDGRAFREVARTLLGEGWSRVEVYSTVRLGDVDGDGSEDVCARESDGVHCWLGGEAPLSQRLAGPAWSDVQGWTEPPRFRSIRLGDVNGDGRADLCAIDGGALRCSHGGASGFGDTYLAPSLGGLAGEAQLASLRIAGGRLASPTAVTSGGCSVSHGRAGLPLLWGVLGLVLARRNCRIRRGP